MNAADIFGLRSISDRLVQGLYGVAQLTGGIASVIIGTTLAVPSVGTTVPLTILGLGTATIGVVNIIEAIAGTADEKMMLESSTLPGLIVEGSTGCIAYGALADFASGGLGTPPTTLLEGAKLGVDALDITTRMKEE